MYKLPISKYKNATPKLVKKDQCISGLSTNRLLNSIGTLVNCSLNYVAFSFDTSSGGSICAISHKDLNKKSTFNNEQFTTLHCHSAGLTDIQFSPFDASLLATSAYESSINLWNLRDGENRVHVEPRVTCSLNGESRCDSLAWNPNVDGILASTSLSAQYIWDVEYQQVTNTLRLHGDSIQSTSWKRDGSMMVTSAKDKTMCIFDPRQSASGILRVDNPKTNNKDSRVCWIGSSDVILSSVYSCDHQRKLHLWDVRNTIEPLHETPIDTGNNVFNPLLDLDTGMLFLSAKAESVVRYYEVTQDYSNILCNSVQSVEDQIKGFCLMPKFGLDLMKCEIDRLILLTRTSVFPLPYIIPRRSYYEFHSDVYPDTYTNISNLHKSDWLNGTNTNAIKTQLTPDSQKNFNFDLDQMPLSENRQILNNPLKQDTLTKPQIKSTPSASPPPLAPQAEITKETEAVLSFKKDQENVCQQASAVTFRKRLEVPREVASQPVLSSQPQQQQRQSKVKSVYYQSKFKYINGKVAHKSEHITNIRNLSVMWPSECNGLQINSKHAAYLLAGSSGQLGVVELNRPGRLPDTQMHSIINKSKISDFAWDPFDDETLAIACDDGVVRVWTVPEDGLNDSLDTSVVELRGHTERLYCIKYHPYVKHVLASASFDRTIKIWNVEVQECVLSLVGNSDVVFSMSWSPCGTKLACVCKDGYVRIYDVWSGLSEPIKEARAGPPGGSKAARIEWVLNGTHLFLSGFGKGNTRQIYLLSSSDLSTIHFEDINQSPSLLIPYYDHDINVVFLYAKGEETFYLYEIMEDAPYFQPLTPYKPETGIHVAVGFLRKQFCDVRQVEIAKTYRLTKDNRIEMISFRVPRVKQAFFQDDIFPSTLDRSKAYLQADEWFNGQQIQLRYVSLQPKDMEKLTENQVDEPKKSNKSLIKTTQVPTISHAMLNQNDLGFEEQKIIGSMLQRATLYQSKSNESDQDSNEEW